MFVFGACGLKYKGYCKNGFGGFRSLGLWVLDARRLFKNKKFLC